MIGTTLGNGCSHSLDQCGLRFINMRKLGLCHLKPLNNKRSIPNILELLFGLSGYKLGQVLGWWRYPSSTRAGLSFLRSHLSL